MKAFSGYGPPRFFSAADVVQLNEALSSPGTRIRSVSPLRHRENEHAFKIYPGFRQEDSESLIDSLKQLREFYSAAAANKMAVVTCLV